MSNHAASEIVGDNPFLESLMAQLKKAPKRLVFAEGEDIRVLQVAQKLVEEGLIVPILLGNADRISEISVENQISLKFVRIIDTGSSPQLTRFAAYYEQAQKSRGIEVADSFEFVKKPHNFAAMMVQYGQADAMIGGNQVMPSVLFRSVLKLMKPLPTVTQVFSVVALVNPRGSGLKNFGQSDVLFLADCNLIPEPTVMELAMMAVETGRLASGLLERTAQVAMLSHSTRGSYKSASSDKMAAATTAARERLMSEHIDLNLIGEVHADVALCPIAAEQKLGTTAHERADVLIFPNLDASHIAYQLLRHVAGAQGYGQLLVGLAGPVAQVPRNVDEAHLFGTAVLLGVEAIKYHQVFPQGLY